MRVVNGDSIVIKVEIVQVNMLDLIWDAASCVQGCMVDQTHLSQVQKG